MRFSPCADMILRDPNYADRLKKLKSVGIDAYEFWAWWGKDLDALKSANEELGMTIATFCTRFVTLIDPAERSNYLAGLRDSIAAAKKLGVTQLISQTGDERPGVARAEQHQSLVDGLKACLPILEGEGVTLLVEPLNLLVDHRGYYLSTSEESFRVMAEVASPNVKILFDIYHQQITEGNLIPNIRANIGHIGHFHVADHPGRHEPGTGEINYANVFAAIKGTGYKGFIGLEYSPSVDPLETLRAVVALAR